MSKKAGRKGRGKEAARLLAYLRPYRRYMISAFAAAVLGVLTTLLVPVIVGEAIDDILGPGQVIYEKMLRLLIILAVTVIVSALFQWLMTYCTNQVTYRTVGDLRNDLFVKLNKVPLKYIDGSSHGDIMNRVVNDIDQISDGLIQGFASLFTGVVTIVGTLLFMISIHPFIALLVVVLTPLSLFVAAFIAKHIYSKFKEQSTIRGELGGYIEEMLGNQKIVKTFCREEKVKEQFHEINSRLYDCGVMAQFYSSLTNPSTRFVNGVVYAAVGIAGAVTAVQGGISIGRLSCFLSYANQYTKPFNEISGVVAELQAAFASAARVFAVLDEEDEPSDAKLTDKAACDGTVNLRHVDFCYQKDVRLIEDLNLDVKPGRKIAIVGPTGCGKTTIINLLMRFYDVDAGQILAGGRDIRQMKRSALRSMYGMVLQETWLFHGTVQENIAYGREDAKKEEIVEAAKAAHAHSFIKRLPKGYDTVISEDGGNISQGQKQLLCIARIMLLKPPMLILDEATSNIDTRTEVRIQKAFLKLMDGRTSFVVAHRLSTIKESDIILVMDKGHIVEQGSHEELLEKGGFYAALYNSQFAVS